MKKIVSLLFFSIVYTTVNYAHSVSAIVYATDSHKTPLGKILFTDSEHGLLIIPHLTGLPAGAHGFHLHQHANCSDAGMSAGGHYDPQNTKIHRGPYAQGHLGDLPVLFVMENGNVTTPLLAPRLKTSDLSGLAIMIHEGGDNYTDNPPLGGGGARIGCGVINTQLKDH